MKCYWKTQHRLRKANTDRGGKRETEINDNVIWWHRCASCSPLVVSPSTNSQSKRVNFVWIGFNLLIRQYKAGNVLQVFSILPQENYVRFWKCTSKDTSAWHTDRQLVQIKNWQISELNDLTLEKSIYRNTCTWQQKTKTKWFPRLVLRNGLSMVLGEYISIWWKGQRILCHSKLIRNGYRVDSFKNVSKWKTRFCENFADESEEHSTTFVELIFDK